MFRNSTPPENPLLTLEQIENLDANLLHLRSWLCAKNPNRDLGFNMLQSLMLSPDFSRYAVNFLFNGKPLNAFPPLPMTKESLIIPVKGLPKHSLPEWALEKVFNWIQPPHVIDLVNLHETSRVHLDHNSCTGKLTTGHEVLKGLVQKYSPTKSTSRKVYRALKYDGINHCHEIEALMYLKQNKPNLPQVFLLWAEGKMLCALADARRSGVDGQIYIPYCFMTDDLSYPIRWLAVGDQHLPSSAVMLAGVRLQAPPKRKKKLKGKRE